MLSPGDSRFVHPIFNNLQILPYLLKGVKVADIMAIAGQHRHHHGVGGSLEALLSRISPELQAAVRLVWVSFFMGFLF